MLVKLQIAEAGVERLRILCVQEGILIEEDVGLDEVVDDGEGTEVDDIMRGKFDEEREDADILKDAEQANEYGRFSCS